MIKHILSNKKLAIGTVLTVLVVLAPLSFGVGLLLQVGIPKIYGYGVMGFSAITFLTIKIMFEEAESTGELKGWSDAYDVNGKRLMKGDTYPGWTFQNGEAPESRSLKIETRFSG